VKTPLEEYRTELAKAKVQREEGLKRVNDCYYARVKASKRLLEKMQETCEHPNFNTKKFRNYHRRVDEYEVTCTHCGKEI